MGGVKALVTWSVPGFIDRDSSFLRLDGRTPRGHCGGALCVYRELAAQAALMASVLISTARCIYFCFLSMG